MNIERVVAVACVLMLTGVGTTYAQALKPKSVEEYQAIADRAYAAAMERAAQEKARKTTAPVTAPLLQVDALRAKAQVDPAEIAERYQDIKAVALPPADELLIFVSSSLSLETLTRIAMQAKQAGAIVMFRGINGDMRKRGEFAKWVKYLTPMINTGASIQINPKLFTQHAITSAPSFVLATREEGCTTDQCKVASTMLEGDVSLDYALEHWVAKGGRFASLAQARLNRMSGGTR